jgi:hypothetical protein
MSYLTRRHWTEQGLQGAIVTEHGYVCAKYKKKIDIKLSNIGTKAVKSFIF